jgi:hypothetical protein
LKIFSFYLFPPLEKPKGLPIFASMQRGTWFKSLRASRRYPGDWENEMNSKFIAAVAVAVAFTMPAMASMTHAGTQVTRATAHSTHGATAHSTHGAMAHGTHGAMTKTH